MTALTWTKRRAFAVGARGPGLDALVYSNDGGKSWVCSVTTAHPTIYGAMEQAHRATEGRKGNGPAEEPTPTGPARLETALAENLAVDGDEEEQARYDAMASEAEAAHEAHAR
jgi:hypothetical protein